MGKKLPPAVKDEIKAFAALAAEKIHCVFVLGFYENGDIYIETKSSENDFDFDEIGAKLEMEKIKKDKSDLFDSLNLWYKIYRRKAGIK